jgi:transposase
MPIKYCVTLNAEERDHLNSIITKGKNTAQVFKRAMVLLDCDEGNKTDQEIALAHHVHFNTVASIRQRFVENGFEACLQGLPRAHKPSIITGEDEARLIALACESTEDGVRNWTLRILSDKFVTLEGEHVSHETIRQILNKAPIKPWQGKEWCIPPKENAEFVADMERVLTLYKKEPDPARPLVCMDESPRQLIGEVRKPLAMRPGSVRKYDTEYIRNGTADVFMFTAPHLGWRRADVTSTRTSLDWAHQMKQLVDVDFPDAVKIDVVCDNLNTHVYSSLYKAFEPEEACRIMEKIELHYTPKHGSWLNMAEIEIGVLSNHGLSDRIPTIEQLRCETAAWATKRNKSVKKITWRFTTADARVKLASLYPQLTT